MYNYRLWILFVHILNSDCIVPNIGIGSKRSYGPTLSDKNNPTFTSKDTQKYFKILLNPLPLIHPPLWPLCWSILHKRIMVLLQLTSRYTAVHACDYIIGSSSLSSRFLFLSLEDIFGPVNPISFPVRAFL